MTTTPPTPATPGVTGTFTYRCQTCHQLVQVTNGVDPHPGDLTECPPRRRLPTVEIRGVWLVKDTAHNGNGIEVIVETTDGTLRAAIIDRADDGPISHYVHPSGILNAPVRTFGEPA